jgi:hypothetical protein
VGADTPVQYQRAALDGVVSAGEDELGFTGRADGRGGALQRCRTGVGSGFVRQQRQGWPATGQGRAAVAHRQRAGGVAGAVGGACVRVRDERGERDGGQVGLTRPGWAGSVWLGQ